MRLLRIFMFLLLVICQLSVLEAEELDFEKYYSPAKSSQIASEAIYPKFMRESDKLSFERIIDCLIIRYEFINGIKPENYVGECHKLLDRVETAIERYNSENETKIHQLDNTLAFHADSPLRKHIRKRIKKATADCNFKSSGDLTNNGVIYCKYHGISHKSKAFLIHAAALYEMRPMLSPDDFADLIIFLPIMTIMIFIGGFALKRVLRTEKPSKR